MSITEEMVEKARQQIVGIPACQTVCPSDSDPNPCPCQRAVRAALEAVASDIQRPGNDPMSDKPNMRRFAISRLIDIGRALERIDHDLWSLYGVDERPDGAILVSMKRAAKELKNAVDGLWYDFPETTIDNG